MDATPSAPPVMDAGGFNGPPPASPAFTPNVELLPNPSFQRSRFTILAYYLNWLVFAFVFFQVLIVMNNTLQQTNLWPYAPPGLDRSNSGESGCELNSLSEYLDLVTGNGQLYEVTCPGFFQLPEACDFSGPFYQYQCADDPTLQETMLPSYLCESLFAVPENVGADAAETVEFGREFYSARERAYPLGSFAVGPQAGDCVACNAGCTGYSGFAVPVERYYWWWFSPSTETTRLQFINVTYDGCTVPIEEWTRDNSDLMSTSGCDDFVRNYPTSSYGVYGPLMESRVLFWFWMQAVAGVLFFFFFQCGSTADEEPSWGAHLFAVNPLLIVYATGALGAKRRLDVMETLVPVTNLAGVGGQLLAIWLEYPILGYTFTWISAGELQNLGQIYVSAGIGIAVLIGRVYLIISSCMADGEVNVEAA